MLRDLAADARRTGPCTKAAWRRDDWLCCHSTRTRAAARHPRLDQAVRDDPGLTLKVLARWLDGEESYDAGV